MPHKHTNANELSTQTTSIINEEKAGRLRSIAVEGFNEESRALKFVVSKESTIANIPKELWDRYFGNRGLQNWEGLTWLEALFQNQKTPENNWKFYYYLLFDEQNQPLVLTFFTECLIKDDIIAPHDVSYILEKERITAPYYMTTPSFLMGSPITTGSNIYINATHPQWKQGLALLLDEVEKDQLKQGVEQVLLRDFKVTEFDMGDFLKQQGFIRKEMPSNSTLKGINWKSPEEHLEDISCRSRAAVAREALAKKDLFDIHFYTGNSFTDSELTLLADLCRQEKEMNRVFNTFDLPFEYYTELVKNPNWEVVSLHLKEYRGQANTCTPIAIALCYKTQKSYIPYHLGIDTNYVETHSSYSQLIYQIVLRAGVLGKDELPFGYTDKFEQRKFGAHTIPQVMYIRNIEVEADESASELISELGL